MTSQTAGYLTAQTAPSLTMNGIVRWNGITRRMEWFLEELFQLIKMS